MFYRKLQKTLELNQTKIDFPGKKIYYDKITLWIAFATNIAFMILSVVVYSFDKQWGFLAIIPLILLFLPSLIRKLLFKNPVFIFQKDRFYYSLEDCWFDKINSKVTYKWVTDSPSIITITDLNKYIVVEETVMYLDDATIFRKEIAKYSDNKDFLTHLENQFDK